MPYKIGLLIICLALLACNPRKEACLNAFATNFDAEAEINCCCTYPTLDISVNHLADTLNYSANDWHMDAGGNLYTIDRLTFFISGLELIKENGNTVQVTDSLQLGILENGDTSTYYVNDSYAYVSSNKFVYSFGNIFTLEDFVGFRFTVGLDSLANHSIPELFDESHVLYPVLEDSMYNYDTNEYYFNKISIAIDTNSDSIPDLYSQHTIFSDWNKVTVEVQDTFSAQQAFDIDRSLNIDYLKFFEGVDFVIDAPSLIEQKILDNTPSAFSVN